MRTTIDIRPEALLLCRQKAQDQHKSLGDVISDAIFAAFQERPATAQSPHYDLPVSGEGGLQPGIDLDCTSALEDLLGSKR
jgi:hypothetical protein